MRFWMWIGRIIQIMGRSLAYWAVLRRKRQCWGSNPMSSYMFVKSHLQLCFVLSLLGTLPYHKTHLTFCYSKQQNCVFHSGSQWTPEPDQGFMHCPLSPLDALLALALLSFSLFRIMLSLPVGIHYLKIWYVGISGNNRRGGNNSDPSFTSSP